MIHLLVGAHRITGDPRYLEAATAFADQAIAIFLDDGSPLPRASSRSEHYEAITRADTMMMALLKLWLVNSKPDLRVDLVYSDR